MKALLPGLQPKDNLSGGGFWNQRNRATGASVHTDSLHSSVCVRVLGRSGDVRNKRGRVTAVKQLIKGPLTPMVT